MKISPKLSPCTRINSKWIKDLNLKPKMLKMLANNIENILEVIDLDKTFLNSFPVAQDIDPRADKWYQRKLSFSLQQMDLSAE